MTAHSIRAAAALASVVISLTMFHGVASLAASRHPAAIEMFAAQTPTAAGSEATEAQH